MMSEKEHLHSYIYIYIYICAAVFRCGKGCEYLCALHLELGAG